MKQSGIPVVHTMVNEGSTVANARNHSIPSAEAWYPGGERIGYDPNARAIVQTAEPLSACS